MRINFRYGAAIGVLAAAFGMLGPMAVQAGQAPGNSVPIGARAARVQPPAPQLSGFAGRSIVLTSMIERSARQHDIGLAQRENEGLANSRQQPGLPGLQNRQLLPNDCHGGCGCWNHCGYGYGGGCWNHCGYGYGGGCGYGHCGYGYGGCGWGHCGYGYGGGCGYGWGHCGYGHGCGYGYGYGHCGYGYGGCGWGHCGYR